MKLKIITPADVQHNANRGPYIRFNHSGLITLSGLLCQELTLKAGDNITFILDEEKKQYYIGKTPKGTAGFAVTNDKSKVKSKYLKFNSSRLISRIFKDIEMPAPSKDTKKSHTLRVDIHNPVVHFGITLYRMI